MGVNNLPPIPQDPIEENARWRTWFLNLGSYIQQTQVGGVVLTILQGGTGANSAAGARQNLGLGTMAVENSNSVAITGGSITGTTVSGTIVPTGGITRTITTAKLTTLGTNGSMTFTNGILTASTQAT
jgi:hypothetical protein